MLEFVISPHVGVGPIRIGMTRDLVRSEFGEPEFVTPDDREAYLEGFFVDYSPDGRVEFIELAKSPKFRAIFNGKCLHEILADDAVEFVQEFDTYDDNDPELVSVRKWRFYCIRLLDSAGSRRAFG